MAAAASAFHAPVAGPKQARDGGGAKLDLVVGGPGYLMELEVDTGKNEVKLAHNNNLRQAGWTPNWMIKRENRLYVVDEMSSALSSYAFNPSTHTLELKDKVNGSSGVVHIAINEANTRLVGAAYGEGKVDVWDVSNRDGKLERMVSFPSSGMFGPLKKKQAAPHPHQAVLDPTGRYFLVNDLGTDTILVIDSKDDRFGVTNRVSVLPAGCGPRHGAFYPKYEADLATFNKVFYMVVCEETNNLVVYGAAYGANNMSLFPVHVVSTYSPDLPPKNASTAAAGGLVLIPRGGNMSGIADVYISNRATGYDEDHIAHFLFDGNDQGSVQFKDLVKTGGTFPRAISTVFGNYAILAVNQKGEFGLTAFKRDPENGALDPKPMLKIPNAFFENTKKDFGPQFVMQVVHETKPTTTAPGGGVHVSTFTPVNKAGGATTSTGTVPAASAFTTR